VLPVKYREVIVLHYLEGYGIKEIAAALSLSESAVKMRLTRGRELLKSELSR
jgi:RNA polymerase sigma-70 factor (ECF subfamily)